VCFLAHLAVEKALKGVLIDAGAPFRPIHDLVELHRTCARFGRPLPINEDALLALNPWVIRGRYGGELSEDDQALVSRLTSFAHEVVSIAKVNLQHDVVLNHGDGRAAGRTSGRGCDGDHHARTRSTGPGMPRSFGVRAPVHALRVEGQGSS
jgi:HEPN domain-containing protein